MTPSDAVTLRTQIAESFLRYSTRKKMSGLSTAVRAMAALEFQALASADLYTWRSDLLNAAVSAASGLPSPVTLKPDLLPSKSGIYLFDEPIVFSGAARPVAAISWYPFSSDMVAFWLYVRTAGTNWADIGPLAAYATFVLGYGADIFTAKSQDLREVQAEAEFSMHEGTSAVLGFLTASWLWLQQRVLLASKGCANARAKKVASRAEVRSDVNVVVLRRSEATGVREEEGSRDYSCQWLVRGHWRQQFYPSTGIHKPVWIEPYVKGPEDKPLKVPTQTVYVVNR